MAKKAIVIANHRTKTATLNFIDLENNLVAFDHNDQPLINLQFPYSNIETYGFLFESLEKNGDEETYLFKIQEN